MSKRVGILSIGTFLPEPVRTNAFWSPEILREWQVRLPRQIQMFSADAERIGEGAGAALQALIDSSKDDPFQGSVERRVMPDDMFTSDMETAAARSAVEEAGIDPQEIGFVVSSSACPDFLNTPNACFTHRDLHLNPRCLSISLDGAMCNSFLLQLELAEQMIRAGRTRYALLIQSSGLTRFAPPQEIFSPWFGDGACAVVVGPVEGEYGLLGSSTRTDGTLNKALVFGVPGKRWWQGGDIVCYPEDPAASSRMLLSTPHFGRQIIGEALEAAQLGLGDVDFYASHQATVWFRRVSQAYIGLDHARTIDTFPWAGTLSGANIPLGLATALKEKTLRDGDVVAMYSGGTGTTYTGAILRWGTGRERSRV